MFDPPKKKKPFASDTLIQPGATTDTADENPFEDENPLLPEADFGAVQSGSSQQKPPLTFGKLADMGKSALVGAGHSLGVDKIGDEVSQQFEEFGADPQRGTKAAAEAQAANPGSYLAGEVAPFVQPAMGVAKGIGKLGGMALGMGGKHPAEMAGIVAALTPTKIGKAWAVRKFVTNLLREKGAKAAAGAGAEAGAGETSILDRMRAATGGMPAASPTPDLLPQGNADKILSQAFSAAGQDAQYVNSGKDAMAAGIQKLSQAPNPLSMEDAFNLAGQQGREASLGDAKMSEGISNIPQAAESIAEPVAQQPSFEEMMSQAGEA